MAEFDGWILVFDVDNEAAGYRRVKDVENVYADLVDPSEPNIWVGFAQFYDGSDQVRVTAECGSQAEVLQILGEALDGVQVRS